MLSVVQAVNLAAIVITLLLVRRSNRICPHHLKAVAPPGPSPKDGDVTYNYGSPTTGIDVLKKGVRDG
jgi:hypothetical protein